MNILYKNLEREIKDIWRLEVVINPNVISTTDIIPNAG
jgi:hypothetical protein